MSLPRTTHVREPIVVVGHRNPDTDSICSAIGYAHLKSLLDPNTLYLPYRLGPLPPESLYVLERVGIPAPPVLTHLHCRVRDVMTHKPLQIPQDATMREAGETLKRHNIRTLIVRDSEGRYQGIIDMTTFANLYLAELDDAEGVRSASDDTAPSTTPTASDGTTHDPTPPASALAPPAAPSAPNAPAAPPPTRRATLARPISDFLTTGAPTLDPEDIVSEVRETVLDTALRQAVVLDADAHAIGILTRTDLARNVRRRVILVDHNESSQAATGIGEAEVVEVVDHHRIGDIQTATPIPFINLPLGSTASIVASEYLRQGVELEPAYATILLAALLTDTVLLRSPTTTPRDRELAIILASNASLDVETFGRELFEARFANQDGSVESIILTDSKLFQRGDARFMISQYETVDTTTILAQEAHIIASLKRLVAERNLEFALVLVTDIMREGSQFIVAGKPQLVERSFNIDLTTHSAWVPGILSRKKQVAPRLLD